MSGVCHEEVADRDGYAQPCEKPAVGWRVDPEENLPYPVCVSHHRWPYADEWVTLAAAVGRARALVSDWQANGNSRELGDPTGLPWQECARQLLAALDGKEAR